MNQELGAVRVLLVDDNHHMRAIVGAILKGMGVSKVQECTDGVAAIRALNNWPADVAIVDLQMPAMDGIEFTRKVRGAETAADPCLPIIMMTGYAERAKVLEAGAAGVTEFVVKPVSAAAIISRMEAVIYRPRPFVRTADYFGPQRQRSPEAEGP